MKKKLYAYQEAEKVLDDFAKTVKRDGFRRAYLMFKGTILLYAHVEQETPGLVTEAAVAQAWEDAEIAFKGLGENTMTGPILQMWANLWPDEKEPFKESIQTAFEEAEAATPADFEWRYLSMHRARPVVGEDGYTEPVVLPWQGRRLAEWAQGENVDVGYLLDRFQWLRRADRALAAGEGPAPKALKLEKPVLRLVWSADN